MDLPHNPTSPELLYQQVNTEVQNLWAYIKSCPIASLSPEIRWKKQPYGAWCIVRWKPKTYCHCLDATCSMGKYVLKETTIIVKNDFSLEAFKHFITVEKQWIQNFVKD